MYIYDFAIQNRELFKLIYTIIIGLVCVIIVVKTNRLFNLSYYQGIRYFRNAFFFYGLAFILRYILGIIYLFSNINPIYDSVIRIVFEFFLIMAGFFLLYSLLWKKFEIGIRGSKSSLFNARILVFYALTIIIVALDYLWRTYFFMFLSQIIIFSYTSIISYIKYKGSEKKHKFLKLYFLVMILNLVAWIANFVVASFLNWHQGGVINIYALNIIIFLLFLYGVIRVTKKSDNL